MKDTDRRSFLLSGVGLGAGAVARSKAAEQHPGSNREPVPHATASERSSSRQTEAEAAAGVTPVDINYPAGDVRRYGADPTGKRDSSTAWTSAISANACVFDGHPGGGTYLFGSEVVISRYPVSISGAVKNIGNGAGGTRLTLAAAAAPRSAIFHTKSFASGLRIEKLQFDWQSYSSGHIGFHASGDLRASSILDCSFVNTAGASHPTVVGIQLDGGHTYTGAVSIRDCYMAGLGSGINLLGHCTTVRIRDNELYGNAPGSMRGINIANQSTGVSIFGNTFEGWSVGIYSEGGYVVQVGNYFEGNSAASFQWIRGKGNDRIWNMSVADAIVSGGAPIYPFNDIDACMVLSGPGYASFDNMALVASRGIKDTDRANEGNFTTPPFDANHFKANAPMQWIVLPRNVTTYEAAVVGGTITVNFLIADSRTAGTGSTALKLAIPGGYKSLARVRTPCIVGNGGAASIGMCEAVPDDGYLYVYVDQSAAANWATSAKIGASGSITFRIVR
jgi:hypothetical protein